MPHFATHHCATQRHDFCGCGWSRLSFVRFAAPLRHSTLPHSAPLHDATQRTLVPGGPGDISSNPTRHRAAHHPTPPHGTPLHNATNPYGGTTPRTAEPNAPQRTTARHCATHRGAAQLNATYPYARMSGLESVEPDASRHYVTLRYATCRATTLRCAPSHVASHHNAPPRNATSLLREDQ